MSRMPEPTDDPTTPASAQPEASTPFPPYPSAPVPAAHASGHRGRKLGAVAAVLVGLLVVALKFGAGFGLASLFDNAKHEVDDAEAVVQRFMETDSPEEATAALDPTADVERVFDVSCAVVLGQDEVMFQIDESTKNADGSATVILDIKKADPDVNVHLVQRDGWKIDRITCA